MRDFPTSSHRYVNNIPIFEDVWLSHSECGDLRLAARCRGLFSCWFGAKTNNCMAVLHQWGKSKVGRYGRRIREASSKVQTAINNLSTKGSREAVVVAEVNLEQLLAEEEVF